MEKRKGGEQSSSSFFTTLFSLSLFRSLDSCLIKRERINSECVTKGMFPLDSALLSPGHIRTASGETLFFRSHNI
jgi:hypothetical protein